MILYKGWGETRYTDGSLPTTYKFTGQRQDSYINLYWYGSRWYDSTLSRFAQADTSVPKIGNTQAWDRYAYTFNSPVVYTDPNGHEPVDHSCYDPSDSSCSAKNTAPPATDKSDTTTATATPSPSSDASSTPTFTPVQTPPPSTPSTPVPMSAPEPSSGAWLIGANFSGSGATYNTSGMEELIWNPNKRANFVYGGEGNSNGVGANVSVYGGQVYNISDPSQYKGPFDSTGITISSGHGITLGCFWESGKDPFRSDTIWGWYVGYAPGAQASYWNSHTIYEETYSTEDNP